jgi:hypothetical protein
MRVQTSSESIAQRPCHSAARSVWSRRPCGSAKPPQGSDSPSRLRVQATGFSRSALAVHSMSQEGAGCRSICTETTRPRI